MSPPTPASTALASFLGPLRVERGQEFTHTSMGRPAGSYYVPCASHDRFTELYAAVLDGGREELHLTEKHRHIGPVVVDLDFRYEPSVDDGGGSGPRRRHTPALAREIAEVYCRALCEVVETPVSGFDVYVLEKPAATMHKGMVKDGLHLEMPDVVTRPAVQLLLRREVLPRLAALFRAHGLDMANRIEDVVDEAVIERNNWMMYGSCKPGGKPYGVTQVLRWDGTLLVPTAASSRAPSPAPARGPASASTPAPAAPAPAAPAPAAEAEAEDEDEEWEDEEAEVEAERGRGGVAELVERLSIRNKYDELPVRDAYRERLDTLLARQAQDHQQQQQQLQLQQEQQQQQQQLLLQRNNTCEDLAVVQQLVASLDARRVDGYDDWIRLGWCLRNIDHRLLETWIEASKRSSKYVEGECDRLWNTMRSGGLGAGTLHMWARVDAPERYREILRTDLSGLIRASINGTHYDVARVVHHLYRYEYTCSNIRNRQWYEFRGHRWRECDSAYSLRRRLSTEVFREYVAVKQLMTQRAMVIDDEAEQKELLQQSKKMADLALKLKVTAYKDNVIKECAELFYQERFEDRLDSDMGLLCFENGVFDLERHEFREGRPDDYCSFSTGINHVPLMPDHEAVRDIMRFWEAVQPCREIREYVLLTLASCLSGKIHGEKFHIWTGSGCHAPGTRLLLASGREVAVEDVRVGDQLLGDDGRTPRSVLRLFRGTADTMYRVLPRGDPLDAFVVNGQHVLSLVVVVASPRARARAHTHTHTPGTSSYEVQWIEPGSAHAGCKALWVERTSSHATQQAAAEQLQRLADSGAALCDGDVLDVTVDAYLAHRELLGHAGGDDDPHLRMYRPAWGLCLRPSGGYTDQDPTQLQQQAQQAYDAAYRAAAGAAGAAWQKQGCDVAREVRAAAFAGAIDGSSVFPPSLCSEAAPVPLVLDADAALALQAVARSLGVACRRVCGHQPPLVPVDLRGTPCAVLAAVLREATELGGVVRRPAHVWDCQQREGQQGQQRASGAPWTHCAFAIERAERGEFAGFELDGNHRYLLAGSLLATHNSNGKSLSVSLFEKTLGQYCCKFPVTLLTHKRAASNVATPEIARAKGRRFAVLQEPSEDERLNVGQLKELSGGDTVQTRELFKAPCEWRPQFKLFLLCNQLPHVPSDDGGTWRRIRVVEFGSKFVDCPSPEHPNEFPIDMDLPSRLDGWKEHFMALLLHSYYRRCVSQPIGEPEAVMVCTREYQRTNDHMADFVDTCIESVPPPPPSSSSAASPPAVLLTLDSAFAEFKEWVRTDQVPIRAKKHDLQRYLDRALIKSAKVKGQSGGVCYRGFRLRDRMSGASGTVEADDALDL